MSISLLGSINVCKVNTGYADKIQSDRIENPDAMTCPLWNGQDSFGRFVHPDSFVTKNAGCNSADDRVSVENFLRPQYMEYVALDAAGFRSPDMFGNPDMKDTNYAKGGAVKDYSEGFTAYPRTVERWNGQQSDVNQFQQDAEYAYRDATNNIPSITGQAGYQYSNNNAVRDHGLNGVWGHGSAGCGRRNGTVERYTPDLRHQQNQRNMYDQASYISHVSNMRHAESGF